MEYAKYALQNIMSEWTPHSVSNNISHLLRVESDGGRRVDVVLELESVQHRRLARRVQPDHGAVVRAGQRRDVLPQRLPAYPATHPGKWSGKFKPLPTLHWTFVGEWFTFTV